MSKQLTYEERLRIEALFNVAKMKPAAIAAALGYTRQSICRELKRGMWERDRGYFSRTEYSAQKAEADHRQRCSHRGRRRRAETDPEQMQLLEDLMLRKRYSPAAAIAEAQKQGHSAIFSVRTVYNYIDAKVFPKMRNKHLPVKGLRRPKAEKPARQVVHGKLPSIEQRPELINQRAEFGHWEGDLIIGKANEKECLLTLVERRSRIGLIFKLANRKAETVRAVFDDLEKKLPDFAGTFRSVTFDNGSEFLQHEQLTRSIHGGRRFAVYYCHSYSAWEKGSVENFNRLVRRFIPKGCSIKKVSGAELLRIQSFWNSYPRGIFGGKCSRDMLAA